MKYKQTVLTHNYGSLEHNQFDIHRFFSVLFKNKISENVFKKAFHKKLMIV